MQTNAYKLEKAYSLVDTHWFPYDRNILNELNSKIKDEAVDRQDLLTLIKKDVSLFLLCLKEVISTNVKPVFKTESPTIAKILEEATLEQIKNSIIAIKSRTISHSVGASSKIQKQRLSEMIVSSQAANKLTEGELAINEIAFSCSLMRQLGLTLIAWNYPRIFEKTIGKSQSKDSLDSEFADILGFSPVMLGSTVLEKWGLPSFYIKAISDRGTLRKVKPHDSIVEYRKDLFSRVSNICAAGEALARATNPTLYSTAEEDIELASEFIEGFLGKEGVLTIIASVRESLTALSLEIPPLLLSDGQQELGQSIKNNIQGNALIKNNPYLSSLPPKLHGRVSKLYQDVIPCNPPYASVSLYAKEIFPITGFSVLHVYLYDPFERKLFPSLVLGKSKLLLPKSVYLKTHAGQYDILVEALETKAPIKNTQFIGKAEEITVLASSLGDLSTVGVVYMELLQSEYEKVATNTELDSLRYFKSLKILLSDCLGLV